MRPTGQTWKAGISSDTPTPLTRTEKQKNKTQSLGGLSSSPASEAILTRVLGHRGLKMSCREPRPGREQGREQASPQDPGTRGPCAPCVPSRNGSREDRRERSGPHTREPPVSRKHPPAQLPLLATGAHPAGRKKLQLFSFFPFSQT